MTERFKLSEGMRLIGQRLKRELGESPEARSSRLEDLLRRLDEAEKSRGQPQPPKDPGWTAC